MNKTVYFGKVKRNIDEGFPLFTYKNSEYDFKLSVSNEENDIILKDSIGRYVPMAIEDAKKLVKKLKKLTKKLK